MIPRRYPILMTNWANYIPATTGQTMESALSAESVILSTTILATWLHQATELIPQKSLAGSGSMQSAENLFANVNSITRRRGIWRRKTGAPARLNPQDHVGPFTCWFWFFRDPVCKFSVKDCVYAHHETKFIALHPSDAKGSARPTPYSEALRIRDGGQAPAPIPEQVEPSIKSPERLSSPPPQQRARRGRDDGNNGSPQTFINLPYQQHNTSPIGFKVSQRCELHYIHNLPVTLCSSAAHEALF